MEMTPEEWRRFLAGATDENIRRPLWDYPPGARSAVIHERRRRFGVCEDEDTPDPEFH